jgi:hypothetical protein
MVEQKKNLKISKQQTKYAYAVVSDQAKARDV